MVALAPLLPLLRTRGPLVLSARPALFTQRVAADLTQIGERERTYPKLVDPPPNTTTLMMEL